MVRAGASIVLAHGAWADGSSWNKVIPLPLAKNMHVIAVQLPLTSNTNSRSPGDDLCRTHFRSLNSTRAAEPHAG
jgi:hypothetical protein